MLDNFLTVFLQVTILFALMAFGFAGGKFKIINDNGSRVMSNVVLTFVTPCLIINSFNIDYDPSKLKGLLISFVASFLIHLFSILLVHLVFKGDNLKRLRVLRFAAVFSNAGYMGLPLQEAVLGADGVFYGSIYVAVFNIIIWTYGVFCMDGDIKSVSAKKLLFNPGIIGVVIGLIFFFLPISLPFPVSSVVSSMASLNTPLAMIVIGFYLSQSNVLKALRDKSVYLVLGLRLIFIPLVCLFVMILCELKGSVLISMVIGVCAPVAAATSMFSTKYNNDIELSVNLVTITTILSIITMPLIVALAQLFA